MLRSEKHRRFINWLPCAVNNDFCKGHIEAAHIRMESNGGMAMKPSDDNVVPLCKEHHEMQHLQGERPFWRHHSCHSKPHKLANALWLNSGNTFLCTKLVNRFAATGDV